MTLNPPTPSSLRAIAAKCEGWIHQQRTNRATKRGKTPSVIPYIGYGSTEWVRVLGRVLYLKPKAVTEDLGRTDLVQISKVRGWRTFTSVAVPRQQVEVYLDGRLVTTVTADDGGVVDAKVDVSLSPGWHTLGLRAEDEDIAETNVLIVDPRAKFGVISDVDDTILKTALPRPLVAAWNTFVVDEQARTATPGMPVLLQTLIERHEGSPIIYLSTGAWNAAPALSRFLARNLYPVGPLLLTDWGPTHDRFFRSGQQHKRRELLRLIEEFPSTKWVLIGDDGQHDEMLYHEFSSQHPENVAAVAIRQISTGEAVLQGGRSKARLHRSVSGVPWVYGPDGATIMNELKKHGIL
ncbi:MAG: App1 family protein [Microbacteriaceae bacterium]